jgi:acylaminoacyl-peptidase
MSTSASTGWLYAIRCHWIAWLIIALMPLSGASAKELLTTEKMLTLDRVTSLSLSRSGRHIAYVVEKTASHDYDKRYDVFVGLSGDIASVRRVISDEKGVSQISWAADGQSLFYLSTRSGISQLWNVEIEGGPPRQATEFALGIIAFRLADHDRLLVAAHDVFPDCADLACTRDRIRADRQRKDTARFYQGDMAPRFMDSYADARFVNLFSAELSPQRPVSRSIPVTPGYRNDVMENAFGLQQDFTLSPNGETVYFAARPAGTNQGDEAPKTIYRADTRVSRPPVPLINKYGFSLSSPRVSLDGSRLAYFRAEGFTYTAPRITVWVRNLATGQESQVGGDLDSVLAATYMNDLQWSDDGATLYAVGPNKGQVGLFSLPAGGEPRFAVFPTEGSVGGYSLGGGRIAYIHSRMTQSPEITVADTNRPDVVRSTSNFRANGSDRFDLGAVEPLSFRGWNGDLVAGFVMKPANFAPGRKYPVILQIHGGPNGAFSDGWDGGPTSPQIFAAKGYAVVMINPHGSSGYGTAFGRAVFGHWGDRPLQDIKAGWARALGTNSFIDADRACAMGASYGGYMALLIAGRWQGPWKCLFAGSPVFDIRAFYYANDITAYDNLSFAVRPWDESVYERQSPVTYVAKWKKPLFIVGGTNDYRVPHDQNISAYGAARAMKIPTQILIFEGESHGVRSPHNVVRLVEETIRWFDRWTGPATINLPSVPRNDAASVTSRSSKLRPTAFVH